MDKTRLFESLSTEDASTVLDLLQDAYNVMTYDQREAIFGRYAGALPPAPVEGATLLEEVKLFQDESLAGAYYAPFAINSKNYRHIPDKTKVWFRRLGNLLEASCRLTAQAEHQYAASCFRILYSLIDAMELGQEIVFADEIGSWMIPGNEQEFIAASYDFPGGNGNSRRFHGGSPPAHSSRSHSIICDPGVSICHPGRYRGATHEPGGRDPTAADPDGAGALKRPKLEPVMHFRPGAVRSGHDN